MAEETNRLALARALSRVRWSDAADGCWRWIGQLQPNGYGTFVLPRPAARAWEWPRRMLAHRFMYELLVGDIPAGHDVHHVCGNRACVSPRHLVAVARGDHARLHVRDVCRQGHAFTETNTYVSAAGVRHCRTCRRLYMRRYRRGLAPERTTA